MTASLVTTQRPVPFVNHLPRWLRFDRSRTIPSHMPVPRILLIDSDFVFTQAFEREASKFQIPVATSDSNLNLMELSKWPYDIVILDLESNGGEFAAEVAHDISNESGGIPILMIGTGPPSLAQQYTWSDSISAFSDKHQGAAAVLSDALQALATMKRNTRQNSVHGQEYLQEVPHDVAI